MLFASHKLHLEVHKNLLRISRDNNNKYPVQAVCGGGNDKGSAVVSTIII